jgi:hypothetical protein
VRFLRGEEKTNYATLCDVALRSCTVSLRDIQEVGHSVDVTAETLNEAIAVALAALKKENWVGAIGQEFTTVPPVPRSRCNHCSFWP